MAFISCFILLAILCVTICVGDDCILDPVQRFRFKGVIVVRCAVKTTFCRQTTWPLAIPTHHVTNTPPACCHDNWTCRPGFIMEICDTQSANDPSITLPFSNPHSSSYPVQPTIASSAAGHHPPDKFRKYSPHGSCYSKELLGSTSRSELTGGCLSARIPWVTNFNPLFGNFIVICWSYRRLKFFLFAVFLLSNLYNTCFRQTANWQASRHTHNYNEMSGLSEPPKPSCVL